MEKKRLIIIVLLFVVLASLEYGIYTEVIWHGWGGFGDPSLEYTEVGEIGISFLVFFIPVSAIAIYLIRIIKLCTKKTNNTKDYIKEQLFYDFIYALFCVAAAIGMVVFEYIIGIYFLHCWGPVNPFFWLGRVIAAFLIEIFNWMTYPVPG
ncbi:MAG: hypothetical protein K2J04_08700 [Lachnospiraceae bacterium]|nr:hypothetical protein [Lachnospiraceae bacterium]